MDLTTLKYHIKAIRLSIKFICFISFCFFAVSCNEKLDEDEIDFPPETPQNFRVVYASDGEVLLRWNINLPQIAKKFKVFRKEKDSLEFKLIEIVYENYFFEFGLDYEKEYEYQIVSVNNKEIESQPSKIVSAKPINRYKPLPPSNFFVQGRNWENEKYFFLTWESHYDTDIDKYLIFFSDKVIQSFDSTLLIGSSKERYYKFYIDSIQYDREYFFAILSLDKGGLKSSLSKNSSDCILNKPIVIFPPNGYQTKKLERVEIEGYKNPVKAELFVYSTPYGGELFKCSINQYLPAQKISLPIISRYPLSPGVYYYRVYIYTKSTSPNVFSDIFYF